MSVNSYSTPLHATATGVGLGYGIAIAVGILVLISTIMLASYLCIRIKTSSTRSSGPHITHNTSRITNNYPTRSSTAAAAPAIGLDGPTIDYYCPMFPFACDVAAAEEAGKGLVGPCAICLGDYAEGEQVRRVPECDHYFHASCVDEWLRVSATCPVCRSSPVPTPVATPLSELIPLAVHPR